MPSYYRVVYRKLQNKKNKTWENDGFLQTDSNQAILYGETLEVIQTKKSAIAVEIGTEYRMGRYEYMVEDSISSLPADLVDDLISNKENETTKTRAGIASKYSIPRSLDVSIAKGKYDSARSFHLHKKSKTIGSQPLPTLQKLEIDPFLEKLLRQHQREGVKFMFDSVMGYNKFNGQGCILADEMGLGKSVQAITLIWVLTKQQPPIIKRTVLVCPVSLIGNWTQEFKKWLGLSRMSIFAVGPTTTSVAEFFIGRVYSVLIIGYERLQKFESELTSGEIDLVICDEGHRLKNKCTVVSTLLNRLKTMRRVILTGTPVQNNLQEYVELINFVNPGTIMYSKSDLDRLDEQMISKIKIETQQMILRRSSIVNERYLKSRTEYFIFCRISENQKKEYQSVIEKGERNCLSTISKLQQIASHTSASEITIELASSKFFVVQQLLVEIQREREKVVLFSQFTSSLDMFSSFFTTKQWKFVRLDGSTPERDRQNLINKFNRDPSIVGFLASTKAGGVGINLVAASKLIMLDLSWNPAHDTQAAARIWRQGQLHPVNIYRFFSTGTIEEKVLFRQRQKINLSTTLENVSANCSVKIDKEEYESLISFDDDTNCLYHDLLKCKNDQKCLESHMAPPFQDFNDSRMELDLDAIKLWNSQFKVALEADTLDISEDEDWSDKDTLNDISIEEIATQGQYNREWLISKCQKIGTLEAVPNICVDILNLLRSKEVDIQNQLVDLVGYDSFEFLEQLLTNRKLIVNNILIEYNRMHRPEIKQEVGHAPFGTQVTVVSKKDQELMKKARKLQRKQKNTMEREDLDSSILLGFNFPIESQPENMVEGFQIGQYQPAEIYPNVFCSGTKSKVISSYASKFVLPEGTVRTDDTDKEEIFIPITPVAPSSAFERLRLISEFPSWIQPAFQGYKSLNRIQSIVYPIAFESNENMLICAPTGAGKTDVALMTILRTITNYRVNDKIEHHDFKIVYVAPMKALAAEIVRKFSKRLGFLKIQVRELTGDMQLTKAEINSTQVIVTTPEKWDVVTRKSVGDTELVQKVKLLILDEVHLLHEDRGSVIEVLVARTLRLVESSQSMIRIVGLSATLPNYADVALFLGVDLYKGLFYFDGGYRPVPLEQHLIGIKGKFGSIAQRTKEDSVCYEIVEELLKNGHQVMIFVHSRKATVNTCKVLLDEAGKAGGESLFDSTQHEKFGLSLKQVQKSRNRELQKYFPLGLGFHNAGMLRTDRNLVEKLFTDGLIKVLCTTATLAWGVNLPAFAVVIKGTKVYNAEKGEFMDLSILDVLQIFGRAGRPQFEDRGVGYILTEHDRLNHYVSAILQQHPIESTFGEKITNNLCAEISLGTISNMTEAVIWLSYTYLYVRMKKNPFNYGLSWQDIAKDPMLVTKRTELILAAAKKLHQAQMIHFNTETGYLTAKDLGRISSNYYIDFNTIEIINRKMNPTMMETEALEMLSMATEFENLRVRQEEKFEMKRLLDRECVCSVKAGIETSSGKANILLQAYISRAFVEDFALSSDTNFVAQNSARIIRALFEIALSRNWGPTASILLLLCKTVDKRLWSFEHPLLQFPFPADIQEKIAKARLNSDMEALRDMSAAELGALLRFQKMGDKVKACIMQFPILRLQAEMFPITRTVSRVSLRIHCDFNWNDQVHGLYQKFYLWVESYDNIELLHFEDILISKKQQKDEILLAFTIPIPYTNTTTDGIPPQIFFRVISDSWLGSETILPFSLRNVIMPMADNAAHTDLLSLQPLPISALHNQVLEDICHKRFEYFNPVQTQVFHTLYNTRHNVLLGAPTGSGKTIAAELAMWSAFRDYPDSKVIYIAPLKALVRERFQDWNSRLMSPMKRRLVELTGDVTPDIGAIESADVIITTPEKWDGVSRSWRQRKYVSSVSCVIIDEIHLLGGDRGPILEVIVSRMNYISSQIKRTIRIVGLSTALANAGDLADWLSCGRNGLFNFRHSVRPVPLEIYIEGYAGKHYCPRMVAMNRPSYLAIMNHSPKQPVLVFVSSRRQTRLTARDFIALCGNDDNPRRFLHMEEHEMDALLMRISDASLKMSLPFGIGLHHAGIVDQDRKIVEELFLNNKIQVLIATSTLAWGVNLPAHLVVIKGTEFYDAKIKGYKDFPITDVLQMMGRAGRPQFDNTGVAVVLVHDVKKEFYKKFLHEPFPVESSLHECVEDHLNAEIVAGTIRSMQDAMDYITWTYLFRRIRMNPTYYGCENNTESAVSDYLSNLIEKSVISLEDCGCVEIGANYSVAPTALGQIASHYYLSHKTMRCFKKQLLKEYSDKSAHSFVLLLKVLANAEEFSELPVRHNEDIQNRELELNLEYPMNSNDLEIEKFTYDSPHGKAFLLLQAYISRFTDMPVADYVTDTISVLDQSIRVVQAMIDFSILQDYLNLCLGLINVLRSLKQALWPTDSPLLMLPHIKHNDLGLLKFGVESVTMISQLCSADPQDVYEMLKPLKLGNQKVKQIQETIAMLPSISISEFLVPNETEKFGRWYLKPSLEYKVKITINRNNKYPTNKQEQYTINSPRFPKPQKEGWFLIVTNPIKNTIVAAKRLMPILKSKTYISSMIKFKTPEYIGEHDYEFKIISDGYYGIETRHVLRMIIS